MERITLIGECLNYPKERNKLIKYHIVSIYKELMNFGVVCYWLHNIIFHIVTQKTSTTSTIKKKKNIKIWIYKFLSHYAVHYLSFLCAVIAGRISNLTFHSII